MVFTPMQFFGVCVRASRSLANSRKTKPKTGVTLAAIFVIGRSTSLFIGRHIKKCGESISGSHFFERARQPYDRRNLPV
jgi:hypothetical protein